MPNLEALRRNVDAVYDLGLVTTKIDISTQADLSLLKDARVDE